MRNEPSWLITLRQRDPERAAQLEKIGDSLEHTDVVLKRARGAIERMRKAAS